MIELFHIANLGKTVWDGVLRERRDAVLDGVSA